MKYKANHPGELVEDMAGLLRACGYTSSFLDKEDIVKRGEFMTPWGMIAKMITNPTSTETKIFFENLKPIQQANLEYVKKKVKKAKQHKKQMKGNMDYLMQKVQLSPNNNVRKAEYRGSMMPPDRYKNARVNFSELASVNKNHNKSTSYSTSFNLAPLQLNESQNHHTSQSQVSKERMIAKKLEIQKLNKLFQKSVRRKDEVESCLFKKLINLKMLDLKIDEYFSK